MNRMVEWFARNSVAANLLMVFLVISGLIAAFGVSSEVMPTMSLDRLQIDVPYLGAAPDEVEEAVCVRIEEAILGVDGIKQIISTASEGMGRVTVELEVSADARRVLDDIKGRVDAIDTFPEETEKPIMQELIGRHRVIDLAVSGQADELALKMRPSGSAMSSRRFPRSLRSRSRVRVRTKSRSKYRSLRFAATV